MPDAEAGSGACLKTFARNFTRAGAARFSGCGLCSDLGFRASDFKFTRHVSFIREQPGLLGLILGIRNNSRILGLLQVNQLLANGGSLCPGGGAAPELHPNAAGKERHGS